MWVLDVLFHPRDRDGEPIFGAAPEERPEYLERLARKRGLPPEMARQWARKMMRYDGKDAGRQPAKAVKARPKAKTMRPMKPK